MQWLHKNRALLNDIFWFVDHTGTACQNRVDIYAKHVNFVDQCKNLNNSEFRFIAQEKFHGLLK